MTSAEEINQLFIGPDDVCGDVRACAVKPKDFTLKWLSAPSEMLLGNQFFGDSYEKFSPGEAESEAGGTFDAEAPPTNTVCFVLTTC